LVDIGGSDKEAMVVDDLEKEVEDEDVTIEAQRVSKLPED